MKPSVLDRNRNLIINPAFIQFDDTELKDAKSTMMSKSEISGFRFGVKPIRGYMFYIGTIFCIDVRGNNQQVIKLRLKSLYGIRRKKLAQKYSLIINALYDYYFDEVILNYLDKFEKNEVFEVAGVQFKPTGVVLGKKNDFIQWENLSTKTYSSYYAIYSKQRPDNYKAFEYLNDWNIGLLYSIIEQIFKNKNLG